MSLPCPICNETKWSNVDQYRFKPSGMSLCQNCGMVSYPDQWASEEAMIEYYRAEYRNNVGPNCGNLYTGQRKLHFHEAFIGDILGGWAQSGVGKSKKIFEVGAAYGMCLSWARDRSGGANVLGSELTTTYRRNAFWEFEVELGEEFIKDKYDMIISYKVIEHQLNPAKKLREYAECLTEGGFLYIGVPIWFDIMHNFGKPGFDLEYYYHKDHINAWTRNHFQTLLHQAGLEIIRFNDTMYDDVYLCKRNDEMMKKPPVWENPKDIEERMAKIKESAIAFMETKHRQALTIWPNFPEAHVNAYEMERAQWHTKGFDAIKTDVIGEAMKDCPNSAVIHNFAADLHMRYDRWEEAVGLIIKAMELKPNNPSSIIQMFHCQMALSKKSKLQSEKLFYLNEAKKAAKHLKDVSLQHFQTATDFLYQVNSLVEIPERTQSGRASVPRPGLKGVPLETSRPIEASP